MILKEGIEGLAVYTLHHETCNLARLVWMFELLIRELTIGSLR